MVVKQDSVDRRGGLSRERETALANAYRNNGCVHSLNALIEANLGFVASVAARYRNCGVEFEDLVAEGNLGLVEAARRFDPGRGNRLISYAVWWIRRAIVEALREQSGPVSVPQSAVKRSRAVHNARQELVQKLGRQPSHAEIGAAAGRSPESMVKDLAVDRRRIPLEDPADEDGFVVDTLADQDHTAEERLLDRERKWLARRAMRRLDPRSRTILASRSGFYTGGRPVMLREVARGLGLSRERIRQLEVEACKAARQDIERLDGRPRQSASPRS